MGIFATNKTVAALAFRLGELSVEVDDLKRTNRRLELEYVELYDKVRHQMSRMAKRAALDSPVNDELPEAMAQAARTDGVDPISAKILARRGLQRQAE